MNTLSTTVRTVGELREMIEGVPDDCVLTATDGDFPPRIVLYSEGGVERASRIEISESEED